MTFQTRADALKININVTIDQIKVLASLDKKNVTVCHNEDYRLTVDIQKPRLHFDIALTEHEALTELTAVHLHLLSLCTTEHLQAVC